MKYCIEPIGVIHSCFKEKFGIPSQAGLASVARGWVEFYPPYDRHEAFVGIEGFSHIWLIFLFHQSLENDLSLTVQPPRRGGDKYGLFATRSPNRPSQIGQSVVELERLEQMDGKIRLHVKGIDLVEGTPILDVKPYVPYVDSIPDARGGFAHSPPEIRWQVAFSIEAEQQVAEFEKHYPDLRQLIIEVLQYDPRPIYYRNGFDKKRFGIALYDLNIRFDIVDEDNVTVFDIQRV